MMGTAATNLAAPVTKTTSGILLLKTASVLDPEQTACIRCGRCIEVCPQGLQPFAITGYVRRGEYQEAKKIHVLDCMECGSCSYTCPARIPLTDYCKLAKYEIRKRNRTTPTMLKISTAPHFYSSTDTRSIMRDVIIALLPAGAVAIALFGIAALTTLVTAVAGCVFLNMQAPNGGLSRRLPPATFRPLSPVFCWLITLPRNMPVWMTLIGCFVAIVITKTAFGGIGKNLFNPALAGRVFLFISFPVQMTTWVRPHLFDFMNTDVTTSATTLNILKHVDAASSATQLTAKLDKLPDYLEMFLGYTGGSMGEVSALALLLGFLYLLYRKVVSWHIPFYYLGTFFILTGICWLTTSSPAVEPITHLLSGGLLLGAFLWQPIIPLRR